MRTSLFTKVALAVVALAAVGVLGHLWQSAEAADEYTFLIRGDVVAINTGEKTITVNSRHTSSAGENDLGGQSVEIQVKGAAFYKYDNKLNKVRTTLGSFDVGQEVVVKGAKKSEGHYNASWVVRNYHMVNIRGAVDSHDVANNFLKINLDKVVRVADKKAYRPSTFTTSDIITVYYDEDSTKFLSRDGNSMNEDEISNDGEQITVENAEVRYGSRFIAGPDAKITDGKYKF